MTQAARSGRQNIAEGSRAAATSSQSELRLVNVARASLDELLLDYEDFLRQRQLPRWDKNSPEAMAVRQLGFIHSADTPALATPADDGDRARWARYAPWLDNPNPAVVANAVICLIHQTNTLLDRQIAALERGFIHAGGYSEQLAAARIAERERARENRADPPAPPVLRKPSQSQAPYCPAAVSRWPFARRKKARMPAAGFGVVRPSPNARPRARWTPSHKSPPLRASRRPRLYFVSSAPMARASAARLMK